MYILYTCSLNIQQDMSYAEYKISQIWKDLRHTLVLEKTLESPLGCREIQPVHPKWDKSWVFIGRADAEAETPVLWPPHAKS